MVLTLAGASASPAWVVVAMVLSAASVAGDVGGFAGALLLGWALGAAGAGWAYAIAGATLAVVTVPLLALRGLEPSAARPGVGPDAPG